MIEMLMEKELTDKDKVLYYAALHVVRGGDLHSAALLYDAPLGSLTALVKELVELEAWLANTDIRMNY